MKRLLTLAALIATLGLPPAAAWEREAFKALKGIKDMATEQAKQEKAAREQAAKEQAERDEQERAAREQAAKEQAERDEQERAAREQAAKEEAAREKAEQARREQERAAKEEAAKQQAERQKWERERRKWEQERRQWEQERQQAEQAQADTPPKADPAPAERAQADSDPQADTDKAEQERAAREQAERERVEQAGGMSCYGAALFEEASAFVLSEQEIKEAGIAALKKNCYGDPNEPPADFQENNPSLGPRHCHKPMLAQRLQEEVLTALRDEAGGAEVEKKRQVAEKKFDALFYEAAEAGCIDKEAMDAFQAKKAERERAARDKAWCEQNADRRTSDMNCFEMEKAYACGEAAWIAAVGRRGEANAKMQKARQTADAADPESMAAFDRVQAERAAAIQQVDLAKKRGQEVIYAGVKNNCPTQAWDMHPGFLDEQFAHRLLLLTKDRNPWDN